MATARYLPERALDGPCAGQVTLSGAGSDTVHRVGTLRVRIEGFEERFRRMWRCYFRHGGRGFRERAISDVQMLFAMLVDRGPVRRAEAAAA